TTPLWNERDGYRRGTFLKFNRSGSVTEERATFDVRLAPREEWSLCIDVTPVVDGERREPLLRCNSFHRHAGKMPMSLGEWLQDTPQIEADDAALERTYRQSILDVAALRGRPDNLSINRAMTGGGLPWFMAIFGRDSLVTAYETMSFHQELGQATLEALAELQATEWDNFRDAEPGKIMHELRRGTLAQLGLVPHSPYYGTHDATMLWLIVLDEYERWTGDTRFVRKLELHARAALAWLEGPADMDGDGYVEYRKRSDSDKALDNHCWKDSDNSILFADGREAEPPIATCEQEGYAYDARLRTARLMREFSGWGIRSMSAEDAGYNPFEYHNGTVWRTTRHSSPRECAGTASATRPVVLRRASSTRPRRSRASSPRCSRGSDATIAVSPSNTRMP